MADYVEKDDLRVVKTHRGLLESFLVQVRNQNFRRVTVNEICEDAQISRATFYSHFRDKYDLLDYWLKKLETKINMSEPYGELEAKINSFVDENDMVIKHILDDADTETHLIIFNFLLALLEATGERKVSVTHGARSIVLAHFCAGGFMSYIIWLVKNNFPKETPAMNIYVYEALKTLKATGGEDRHDGRFLF